MLGRCVFLFCNERSMYFCWTHNLISPVLQREAWRGAAEMLAASAAATREGVHATTKAAACLAAQCNTQEGGPPA